MAVVQPKRRQQNPGRKPLEWRPVLDGNFYMLRTGCQWKAAPPEFCSGNSWHRYFQRMVEATLESVWVDRAQPRPTAKQHRCADNGYD